jgi:hypothetical protein
MTAPHRTVRPVGHGPGGLQGYVTAYEALKDGPRPPEPGLQPAIPAGAPATASKGAITPPRLPGAYGKNS